MRNTILGGLAMSLLLTVSREPVICPSHQTAFLANYPFYGAQQIDKM